MNAQNVLVKTVTVKPTKAKQKNRWKSVFRPIWIMELIFGVNRFLVINRGNICLGRVRLFRAFLPACITSAIVYHVYVIIYEPHLEMNFKIWIFLNDLQWTMYIIIINAWKHKSNVFVKKIGTLVIDTDKVHYNHLVRVVTGIIVIDFSCLLIVIAALKSLTTLEIGRLLFYAIGQSANDLEMMNRCLMYYAVRYQATEIHKQLKIIWKRQGGHHPTGKLDWAHVSIARFASNKFELADLRELYEKLLGCAKHINRDGSNNFLFFLELATTFLKGLISANILVRAILKKSSSVIEITIAVFTVCVCVKTFALLLAPCVVAHSTMKEEKKIKLVLSRMQFASYLEADQRSVVRSFLLLLEARPLRYSIFRMISLDPSLPLTFFSLCTSYIIVNLQFTNF